MTTTGSAGAGDPDGSGTLPGIRSRLDVEIRATGPDSMQATLTGLDCVGNVGFPITAVAVPAGRVHDVAPFLQGTRLNLVAVHQEPLGDVSRSVRRSLAAGADEVEVPWSALPATVDALGFDTTISCDLGSVPPEERTGVAQLALTRGARMLRCSIEDLGPLSTMDRIHGDQRIKIDTAGLEIAAVVELLARHDFGHPTRVSIEPGADTCRRRTGFS